MIGGGVVGISVGYHCSASGLSTAVVEKHERLCEEASTHNSGVLHSGFNPSPGTLKAAMNKRGIKLMYEKADAWKFTIKKVGTLVVARTESESKKLKEMKKAGEANGVSGLRLLMNDEISTVEPYLDEVHSGLYSPEGGVIDIMEYIARLTARANQAGTIITPSNEVLNMRANDDSISLTLSTGETVSARVVVNSAGLNAGVVAGMLGSHYSIYPCVGEYAYVVGEKAKLINGTVYPVVVETDYPGLGIHLTKTINGELQVGPTAVYADKMNPLTWKRTELNDFHRAVKRFLPDVQLEDMREGWFGVRAKTVGPASNRGFGDFIVEWDRNKHPAIHLVGIESPGFTASLAIGEHVAAMILKKIKIN